MEKAAQEGDVVHAMAAATLRGESTYASHPAYPHFQRWLARQNLTGTITEQNYVSKQYGYQGTIDFYAYFDGVPTLCDIKTSSGFHSDQIIQLAAYRQLLIENGLPVAEMRLVRIDRSGETGVVERLFASDFNLQPYWEVFLACLKLYQAEKALTTVEFNQ
jgi:hypothetical protein